MLIHPFTYNYPKHYFSDFLKKRNYREHTLKNKNTINLENKSTWINGDNGAGKSTFLKLISGRLRCSQKIISDQGKTIFDLETLQKSIVQDATMSENAKLISYMLSSNNILSPKDIFERLMKKCSEYGNTPYVELSSGWKKRLILYAIESIASEVIIIDEWIGVIDKQTLQSEEIKSILETKQLILTTHNATLAKKYCKNEIVIDAGVIKKQGENDNGKKTN